jgi:immune inhibitor A
MAKNSDLKWLVIAAIGTFTFCLIVVIGAVLVVRLTISNVAQELEAEDPYLSESNTPTPFDPPTVIPADQELSALTLSHLSQVVVPENDRIELAERLKGIPDIPRILAESAEPVPVGTVNTFWVGNVDTIEHSQVKARLVYSTDHVYFWIEEGIDYDLEDVKALVDDFEGRAYPVNRKFFGSEWSPGIDGDEHLYILYARDLGYSVAGYFSTADEISPLANEYSNGHEMFYLSADNISLWEEFTYSVLAHEFQHMIHWGLDRNEESWVNEGFSELAAHLSGFDVGGWDYAYVGDPDIPLTYWPTSGDTHYGQAFLFMTYFLDRFGSAATQALVANPANGLDSIDSTLEELGISNPDGTPVTADDVFTDWAVAMLLQDPDLADGQYGYRSYDPPTVDFTESIDDCPVEASTYTVSQYGIDYIEIACRGEHMLEFQGTTNIPVLPGEPHSGDFAFWSNRGDESDMTLTRRFDFSELDGPIDLEYWVWYDIEEGWDYLYLEASTDGGETWQILNTPSGTDHDLSGNSYGWAYTGFSGGGFEPEWIREQVDLSDFAGQEVLLRFEYITDAAVNGDGLLLDDIRIAVLADGVEDFEKDEGGWVPEGFVRLYNRLPQTYRLVLVEHGDTPRVTEVLLDEIQRAEIPLDINGEFDRASLIVIGSTRHTWQPAPYSLSIQPR